MSVRNGFRTNTTRSDTPCSASSVTSGATAISRPRTCGGSDFQ